MTAAAEGVLRFYGLGPVGSSRDSIDVRRMRAPRRSQCSICQHPTRALVVITKEMQPVWTGICLWCIEQLAEAAENGAA